MVQQCPDGRWFLFSLAMDSVIVLEKKDMPEHLLEMNALDRPTFLKKLLAELEDLGEASQIKTLYFAIELIKLIYAIYNVCMIFSMVLLYIQSMIKAIHHPSLSIEPMIQHYPSSSHLLFLLLRGLDPYFLMVAPHLIPLTPPHLGQ